MDFSEILLRFRPEPTQPLSPSKLPQPTTKKERVECRLAEARDLENHGNNIKAQETYAEVFWTAEITSSSADHNATFVSKPPLFRFMCMSDQHNYGEEITNFLYGKLLVEGNEFSTGDVIHSVKKDYKEAIHAFKKAAEKGYEPALDALQQAAQKNCPEANFRLYELYSDGKGVPANQALAEKFLKIAADLKHTSAALAFARINAPKHHSQYSSCFTHFLEDAIHYYQVAIVDYPAEANFELAEQYEKKGTKKDYQLALSCYTKANHARHGKAEEKIQALPKVICAKAVQLLDKTFGESDAITLLEYAEELNYIDAKFELGKIYESRSRYALSNSDADTAIKYYEAVGQSQSKNAGEALLRAGKLYEKIGLPERVQQAYKEAADKGNIEAKARLGDRDAAYEHAVALQQKNPNDSDAIVFYKIAAAKKHPEAAFYLYKMHLTLIGKFMSATNHESEAGKYFLIALNAEHPEAIKIREGQKLEIKEQKEKVEQIRQQQEEKKHQLAEAKKTQEAEQRRLAEEAEAKKRQEKLAQIQSSLSKQPINYQPINSDIFTLKEDSDSEK